LFFGIVIGTSGFATQLFTLPGSFGIRLISALVGAIIGGLLAGWLLGWWISILNKRRQVKDTTS
jgi:NhaP-type Na+/H+ or K+/H+ antiporter